MISLPAISSIADLDPARYNITENNSCPYQIVFKRLQVVRGEMVSWDWHPKKRPHKSPDPGPSKRPVRSSHDAPKPQSQDEDVVLD